MKSDIQEEQKNLFLVVKVVEQQYLRMLFMLVKHMPLLHDIGCQDGFQRRVSKSIYISTTVHNFLINMNIV